MSILMTRSYAHLAIVNMSYVGLREEGDGKSLIETIKSEFTGSEEAILSTIGQYGNVCCYNRSEFVDTRGRRRWCHSEVYGRSEVNLIYYLPPNTRVRKSKE